MCLGLVSDESISSIQQSLSYAFTFVFTAANEVFKPDFDEPVRELFMWSVLMNRLEMAMLFWDEGKVWPYFLFYNACAYSN